MSLNLSVLSSRAGLISVLLTAMVQAMEFHGLGDLPGGKTTSSARAIASDGRAVVGSGSSAARPESGSNEAYVWTPEAGMLGLGFHSMEENYSIGIGVSADGSTVVGGGSSSDGGKAFRWTHETGMQELGVVDSAVAWHTFASAVNHDGSIVTGRASVRGAVHPERAFIWTEDLGMSYLPPVPWMDQRQKQWPTDMSHDGTVVVGNSKTGNPGGRDEGFLWSAENGYTHIAPQGDIFSTRVRAVSADGTTVVGGVEYIVDGRVPGGAMWWRQDVGVVDVGGLANNTPLGAFFYDISGNGQVAVGQDWLDNGVHPIIWDEFHGVGNLEQLLREDFGMAEALGGWKLERAFAASHDGLTIVGRGVNPQGNIEAWRIVLDEAPAPILIPGDANLNGHVDFADLLRLSSNFERGAFWYQGDFDGNHRINMDDFVILAEAFGRTPAVVVPEPIPNAMMYLAVATILSLFRRTPTSITLKRTWNT